MSSANDCRRPNSILRKAPASQKLSVKQKISKVPVLGAIFTSKTYIDVSPPRNAIQKRVRFSEDTKLYDEANDPTLIFGEPRGNRKIDGYPVAGTKEFARHQTRLNREHAARNAPPEDPDVALAREGNRHSLREAIPEKLAMPRGRDPRDEARRVYVSHHPPRIGVKFASAPGVMIELRQDLVAAVFGSQDPEHTLACILDAVAVWRSQ